MHLKEGSLLKNVEYRIVRFIASGGFGCTYEAVHQMLNKRVAIKEFFPKSLCNRDPETSQISVGTLSQVPLVNKLKTKFINEARSIAQLSHSGIVRVSDVFEENGTAYYVMDYIDGQSLGKIIYDKGKLSEQEALDYINQVCDALDYVHSKNRLHLDVKPGNIMIDDEGHAILIDFGASKQYDEENGENTSSLIGKTPGYAPIEQMGNNVSKFRPATDIYSLGATLYKCLSGKTPLEANELADGEELEPLPNNVSESTKNAIKAAMEVSSKKRPQTIKEFSSILNQSNTSNNKEEKALAFSYDSSNKDNSRLSMEYADKSSDSNLDESDSDGESSSSKTKIIIGAAAALIIALICWMAFGRNKTNPTVEMEENIGMMGDSIYNSNEVQNNKENTLGGNVSFLQVVVIPTNIKVGEEFKVVYRLNDSKGEDFKAKEISGCFKVSGPDISATRNRVEYTYIYKAEKEGTYTIPSATVKVNGKAITSNSQKISVLPLGSIAESEELSAQTEPVNSATVQQEDVKSSAAITGTINGHQWVDLGLPSGLKWATTNIDAITPEQFGSYFAWGETKARSEFTEKNSETFKKNNKWLTKNGYLGSNGNLTPTHDAAKQNWGGSWRMPTMNEIEELRNNTTAEWTTRNGVNGYLIKSRKNDSSIFLPAGGWRDGSLLDSDGFSGRYWSSTPKESDSKLAVYLGFSAGYFYSTWDYRYTGLPVRPVSE